METGVAQRRSRKHEIRKARKAERKFTTESRRSQRIQPQKLWAEASWAKISKLIFPSEPHPIPLNACTLRACYAVALAVTSQRDVGNGKKARQDKESGKKENTRLRQGFGEAPQAGSWSE
jgi:hypothetical protein